MVQDKPHRLPLDAIRQLQERVKADGFRSMPDEKAFMDELSGEDDSTPEARPPAPDNDLP